ncbi:MAG: HRDC domain-containing protein [Nocardioidaceae bacterium]
MTSIPDEVPPDDVSTVQSPADAAGPAASPPGAASGVDVPLLELADGVPEVVDHPRALSAAVERLAAGTGPFAIDAERASGHRYSQRAYLVQMRRTGAGTIMVDPVRFGEVPNESLSSLGDAVGDAEWIIHAASQDLPCLAQLGLRPRRLFDTELAGRLLNFPRVGLASLVEELLGARMRKEHSAADWSRRPLPESWVRYAALDVEVLIELRDVLAVRLEEAGKASWAAEEFDFWAEGGTTVVRDEPWRRTTGINRVRGRRGLALARALWEVRNQLAERRDITPRRVLTDAAIVEAASQAPRTRLALSQLPTFSVRGAQRHLGDFHDAIAAALRLPETDLPSVGPRHDGPPSPRAWAAKFPEAAERLGRCREAVLALARDLDLPQENLLSPDCVRRLAWSPPEPVTDESVAEALRLTGARSWQISLTTPALTEALDAEEPLG